MYVCMYPFEFDVLEVTVPRDTMLGDLLEHILPSLLDLHRITDPMEPLLHCPELDEYTFVHEVLTERSLSVSFEVM